MFLTKKRKNIKHSDTVFILSGYLRRASSSTWPGRELSALLKFHITYPIFYCDLLRPSKVRSDRCGKSSWMRTWVCTDYRLEGNQLYYGIKKGRIVTPQANITFVETEWLVGKIILGYSRVQFCGDREDKSNCQCYITVTTPSFSSQVVDQLNV